MESTILLDDLDVLIDWFYNHIHECGACRLGKSNRCRLAKRVRQIIDAEHEAYARRNQQL